VSAWRERGRQPRSRDITHGFLGAVGLLVVSVVVPGAPGVGDGETLPGVPGIGATALLGVVEGVTPPLAVAAESGPVAGAGLIAPPAVPAVPAESAELFPELPQALSDRAHTSAAVSVRVERICESSEIVSVHPNDGRARPPHARRMLAL